MAVSVFDYMVWTKRKVMHSIVRIERPEQSAFNAGTAYCSNSCIEDNELLLVNLLITAVLPTITAPLSSTQLTDLANAPQSLVVLI